MTAIPLCTPNSWSRLKGPLPYVNLAVHARSRLMPCFKPSTDIQWSYSLYSSKCILCVLMHGRWHHLNQEFVDFSAFQTFLLIFSYIAAGSGLVLLPECCARLFIRREGKQVPVNSQSCTDLPIISRGSTTSKATAVRLYGLPHTEMVVRLTHHGPCLTMLPPRRTSDSPASSTLKVVRRA